MKSVIVFLATALTTACGTDTTTVTDTKPPQVTTRGSLYQDSPEGAGTGNVDLTAEDGSAIPYPTDMKIHAACVQDGVLSINLRNISEVAGRFKLDINGVKTDWYDVQARSNIVIEIDVARAEYYKVRALSDQTSADGLEEAPTDTWYSKFDQSVCP